MPLPARRDMMLNDYTRTRIKICGMTQMAEARAAVQAGVDALGFIFFAKSPRNITPDQAREIIATLPPFVDAVGVFVNEELDHVRELVQYCGLTVVQLHGIESPEYCEKVGGRILKAFSVRPGEGGGLEPANGLAFAPYADKVKGFLLDTFHPAVAGGSGQAFDWDLLANSRPPGPLILAGGLSAANVGEAVRRVRPFAVDVNSGVEVAPGIKDIEQIRQVVAEVRRADNAS